MNHNQTKTHTVAIVPGTGTFLHTAYGHYERDEVEIGTYELNPVGTAKKLAEQEVELERLRNGEGCKPHAPGGWSKGCQHDPNEAKDER